MELNQIRSGDLGKQNTDRNTETYKEFYSNYIITKLALINTYLL